jgi:DNA damage-binding protein 1
MAGEKGESSRLTSRNDNGRNYSKVEADVDLQDDETTASGDFVKAVLFGALDGVLTSFAIVAGATGGGMGTDVVVIVGFSSILADALSMGVGEYLSSKAHNDYVEQARKREEWHVKNNRERGVEDMVEMYLERGMEASDARAIVNSLSKYDKFFVDALVSEELGVPNYKQMDECDCIKEGILMFFSFVLFGSLPLLPFLLTPHFYANGTQNDMFLYSCIATGISLFIVGSCKSSFSARGWFFSGLETVLLGGACSGLAYEVGLFLEEYAV